MSLTLRKRCLEMTNHIAVYYVDLPPGVKGFTKLLPDDCYAIIINSRLSTTQNERTLEHELNHIASNDLYYEGDVNSLEYVAHL